MSRTVTLTKENIEPCPCGCAPCEGTCCNLDCLEKPRFFSGQLLSDQDLTSLVTWVENKSRLKRFYHGWGIVCGLEVRCHPTNHDQVVVSPGYAISCCGDDIVVCEEGLVDICQHVPRQDKCPETGETPKNKKMGHLELPISESNVYYFDLFLRYEEKGTVAKTAFTQGNSRSTCEPSRTLESFTIEVKSAPTGKKLDGNPNDQWQEESSYCFTILDAIESDWEAMALSALEDSKGKKTAKIIQQAVQEVIQQTVTSEIIQEAIVETKGETTPDLKDPSVIEEEVAERVAKEAFRDEIQIKEEPVLKDVRDAVQGTLKSTTQSIIQKTIEGHDIKGLVQRAIQEFTIEKGQKDISLIIKEDIQEIIKVNSEAQETLRSSVQNAFKETAKETVEVAENEINRVEKSLEDIKNKLDKWLKENPLQQFCWLSLAIEHWYKGIVEEIGKLEEEKNKLLNDLNKTSKKGEAWLSDSIESLNGLVSTLRGQLPLKMEKGLVEILFWIIQDCHNSSLKSNCECSNCDESKRLSIGRVCAYRTDQGECRIFSVDTSYRRNLSLDCPADQPIGCIDVSEILWQTEEEAKRRLKRVGIQEPDVKAFTPKTFSDLHALQKCHQDNPICAGSGDLFVWIWGLDEPQKARVVSVCSFPPPDHKNDDGGESIPEEIVEIPKGNSGTN